MTDTTQPQRASEDECNAVAELREMLRAFSPNAWGSEIKRKATLAAASKWLADYDQRKPQ